MKHCRTCNTTKPLSEFPQRGDRKGGVASRCKACKRAYEADYHLRVRKAGKLLGVPTVTWYRAPEEQALDKLARDWTRTARWPVGWTIGRAA